ncbi:Uncharacterised protein [Mycobacterium tuberculosis]|nr:Uncharacterised protein [Mycobacterium tuberculosis]CKT41011.1 Uncharacterised protein [Mycobacterium tuberculosis]CKT72165.1 Uncharacterised protein [Mycobacterium tuberculosis]CNW45071.1 Uncharacterised protein [Mycobacterium tuberculosis]CNZ55445.1 Uncharacterised protein [Mycobacterium tuberculosis]
MAAAAATATTAATNATVRQPRLAAANIASAIAISASAPRRLYSPRENSNARIPT